MCDSKLLHIVFGVSGVAMLVTTVWMLAADHNREWKPVQRKFREIETWYTQAKITDQDDARSSRKGRTGKGGGRRPRPQPPAEGVVTAFLDEARPRVDQNGYQLTVSKRPTRPCAKSRVRRTAMASRRAQSRLATDLLQAHG